VVLFRLRMGKLKILIYKTAYGRPPLSFGVAPFPSRNVLRATAPRRYYAIKIRLYRANSPRNRGHTYTNVISVVPVRPDKYVVIYIYISRTNFVYRVNYRPEIITEERKFGFLIIENIPSFSLITVHLDLQRSVFVCFFIISRRILCTSPNPTSKTRNTGIYIYIRNPRVFGRVKLLAGVYRVYDFEWDARQRSYPEYYFGVGARYFRSILRALVVIVENTRVLVGAPYLNAVTMSSSNYLLVRVII